MRYLKQSTATTITVGPTLDEVDFITPITSLTHAGIVAGVIKGTTDSAITVTASGGNNDLVHIVAGLHSLELTTGNTDTLGRMRFHMSDADSFMPVTEDFQVVTANVFDSLFGSGDLLDVNTGEISGDSTAADNLELQYDATGLSGDNFPAQQHQVADLAVTGSAIHVSAESYVLTTGTQSSNTVTDTGPLDGTNHEHTDDAGAMELYYQFDVTADGVATSCTVNGYLNNNNDDLEVYAFNWGTTTFERIGTLDGQNSATNGEHDYILFTAHTGTGANNGKVRIRFFDGAFTLSSATLAIDQIFVSYAVVRQTVGYALGRIWINTALSNTNTADFVDGTAENPVSTLAAAKTLSTSLGLSDFQIINGSTIALAETSDNESYFGDNWTLDLSDESCASAHFEGPSVSGLQTGTDCSFVGGSTGTMTIAADAHLHDVALGAGTITLPVGAVSFDRCHHSGTTAPILEFGTAVGSTTVHMHGYAGGVELNNFGDNGTDILFLDGNGKLIINNTSTGTDGTIHLRGHWEVDDQSTGSLVINYDDQSITRTRAELASVPAATSSLIDKITYMFMLARNKMTQSSTTQTLLADDGSTTVGTSSVSQAAGITTREEAT